MDRKTPNPSGTTTVVLRLPSGQEKAFPGACRAVIGTASNPSHAEKDLKKAGRRRNLGWRPRVRGMAMNAVDHPHGGGRGKRKGGLTMSKWWKICK